MHGHILKVCEHDIIQATCGAVGDKGKLI